MRKLIPREVKWLGQSENTRYWQNPTWILKAFWLNERENRKEKKEGQIHGVAVFQQSCPLSEFLK